MLTGGIGLRKTPWRRRMPGTEGAGWNLETCKLEPMPFGDDECSWFSFLLGNTGVSPLGSLGSWCPQLWQGHLGGGRAASAPSLSGSL